MARKKMNNTTATLVGLGALVLIIVIAALVMLLSPGDSAQPGNGGSAQEGFEIDSELVKEGPLEGLELDRDEEHDDGEFHYLLNSAPVFANGKAKGSVMLENGRANSFYMQVDYALEDGEGTIVYRSPMVPPGHSVPQDRLYQPLEAGEHDATAMVAVYDSPEASSPVAIFEEYITITVEK